MEGSGVWVLSLYAVQLELTVQLVLQHSAQTLRSIARNHRPNLFTPKLYSSASLLFIMRSPEWESMEMNDRMLSKEEVVLVATTPAKINMGVWNPAQAN